MSSLNRKRNIIIAALAAIGVIGVASAGYAVFSATSTANAGGNSANLAPLNVDTTAIVFANSETALWPNVNSSGDTPADPTDGVHLATVTVPVTNTNEVPVKVTSGGISGTFTFNTGADQAACGIYLKQTAISLLGGPVIVGASGHPDATKVLSLQYIYLDATAPNSCANKAFTTTWSIPGQAI